MDKKKKSDSPVGYKKPPSHSQFKPGQSGNRSGRPKQVATFGDVVERQLRKKVTVTKGNTAQRIQILEAIAMTHVNLAAKGNPKSTDIVLNAIQSDGNSQGGMLDEFLQQIRLRNETRKLDERTLLQLPEGKKTETE